MFWLNFILKRLMKKREKALKTFISTLESLEHNNVKLEDAKSRALNKAAYYEQLADEVDQTIGYNNKSIKNIKNILEV